MVKICYYTPMIPTFETNRLILRHVTQEDVPTYQRNFADYEVIKYLAAAVPWPYPETGVLDFLNKFVLPEQGKTRWFWGIFLKENPNEVIGAVDLWRTPRPENRGFWLARKHWGKGNQASRRIKEKTGARFVGTQLTAFVDPQFTERELWELTKEEWLRFRKMPLP